MHGSSIDPSDDNASAVIGAFLGMSAGVVSWEHDDEPRQRLQWSTTDADRVVVPTRALSADVTDEYLGRVRRLVLSFMR